MGTSCALIVLALVDRLASLVLLPANSSYVKLETSKKELVLNSVIALSAAVAVPPLALLGIQETPNPSDSVGVYVPVSEWTVLASGISVGFMLFDSVHLLLYPHLASPIMWVHHGVSILVWPVRLCCCTLIFAQYAALTSKGHWYLNFLLFTEITNIGQHLRILIDKLGYKEHPVRIINGICWTLSFFVVRIAPIPYVLWEVLFVGQNLASFTTLDYVLIWITALIPVMMNTYWFYLIVTGLLAALTKGKAKTKSTE